MFNIKELYDFVYREFKIKLDAYKEVQMHRRIEFFISKTEAKDVKEFIELCKRNSALKNQFLDLITINVTEFFRNPEIFLQIKDIFRNTLPERDTYMIWSSACSNGSEPYSVAMILNDAEIYNYKIIATDIDKNMLDYARRGIYKEDEINEVPSYYLSKYFEKFGDEYRIKNSIKSDVMFRKHDLILDEFPIGLDFILCRNVIIYFKKEEKMKIHSRFYDSLNNEGVVFIGATENIYDYNQIGFIKLGTFFYQKVVK